MRSTGLTPLNSVQRAEFCKILGSPPVLSFEDQAAYQSVEDYLNAELQPRDFMEMFLIRGMATDMWKLLRYSRHQVLASEQRLRDDQHARAALKQYQVGQLRAGVAAAEKSQPPTELSKLTELRANVIAKVAALDALTKAGPTELDHSRAVEKGIAIELAFDRLINAATGRRDNALRQLAIYRDFLNARAIPSSNTIEHGAVSDIPMLANGPASAAEESSAVEATSAAEEACHE
jgi:hypothetical protein